MKNVEICISSTAESNTNYDINGIEIKGFDFSGVVRFGKFLGEMMQAENLIIHQVEDTCEGYFTYQLDNEDPDYIDAVEKEDVKD